jgi:hypothetical protein
LRHTELRKRSLERIYMFTQRIHTHLIQRGIDLGFLTGACVGAGYGALIPLPIVVPALVRTYDLETLASVLLVTFYVVLIDICLGGLIGSLAGIIFGLVNGVAIGALTVTHYVPPRDPREYYWSVCLMSLLVTSLCCFLGTLALGRIPHEQIDLVIFGIPLLLTLPCAWFAGARLAHSYLIGEAEAV